MIDLKLADGVAVLRLAHGKASALDLELLGALRGALGLASRDGARALVLTGTGSIFSAGVDLFRFLDGGADYAARFLPALSEAIEALFALELPVVAAVNGHAIAGGCVLASACDYRIMASGQGRIGVPELLVGVPFPAAALEAVRFAVPPDRLQEVLYLGATFAPEEALSKGLLDEVVAPDELDRRAGEVAARLAAVPSAAFALTKRQVRRPSLERMREVGAATAGEVLAVWSDPTTHDHIRRYLERTVGRKG